MSKGKKEDIKELSVIMANAVANFIFAVKNDDTSSKNKIKLIKEIKKYTNDFINKEVKSLEV